MNSWPWHLSSVAHMLTALGPTYVVLPPDGVLVQVQLPLPTHQAGVTWHTWRCNRSEAGHEARRHHLQGAPLLCGSALLPAGPGLLVPPLAINLRRQQVTQLLLSWPQPNPPVALATPCRWLQVTPT